MQCTAKNVGEKVLQYKRKAIIFTIYLVKQNTPLEITFEDEANHNIPKLDFDPSIPYHSILLRTFECNTMPP